MFSSLCHRVLFVVILVLTLVSVSGQVNDIPVFRLEDSLGSVYGVDKLIALNRLTEYYTEQGSRKAIRYGKQAVTLGEMLFWSDGEANPDGLELLARAYNLLALAQYDRESFFEARRHFSLAEEISRQNRDRDAMQLASKHIQIIDSLVADGTIKQSFFSKTFGNAGIGEAISGVAQSAKIETEILQGQTKENKGEFADAIGHYTTAANLLRNTGDGDRINSLQIKIAALYDSLGQFRQARETMENALAQVQTEVRPVPPKVPRLSSEQHSLPEPRAGQPAEQENLIIERKNLKEIADKLAEEEEYEKSLAYYQLYQDLTQRLYEDSVQTELERENRERELMLLSQQKQIAELKLEAAAAEEERQARLQRHLLIVLSSIVVVSLVILYYYLNKRKEHQKLSAAYNHLEHTKSKLEHAEQRIVNLLAQQVSGEIANELLTHGIDHGGVRRFVCIMFLDIRGFTEMAEAMTPEDLILYQNNVFSLMIDIVQKHHGNINQLLGDGFMATFGAPISHDNDCQNAFNAGREILTALGSRNMSGDIPHTRIGIGLHAGHVVTGNVGSEKRKQYSITGNAVIIASRVEQLNKKYKSQLIITEDVYKRLDKPLALEQPFLEVTIKGRTQPVKILKIA